jgi:dipeptidyl aminopeptidase/acylaminoacyl peptidase
MPARSSRLYQFAIVCLYVAALASAAAAGIAATPTPDAKPAPLEAYGRLPTITHVALSTGGGKLAFIVAVDNLQLLNIVRLEDNTPLGRFNVGEAKVRGLLWADDGHLLIRSASSRLPFGLTGQAHEMSLLQSWDEGSNKVISLLGHVRTERRVMNIFFGRPTITHVGGQTQLFVAGEYFNAGKGGMALVRVNLDRDTETLVREGREATQSWLVDDQGEVVAEEDYFDSQHRWAISLLRNGRAVRTVGGDAPLDFPQIFGLHADGAAAIIGLHEDNQYVYRQLSLVDGSLGSRISPNEAITGLLYEPGGQRVIGTEYVGDEVRYRFFDAEVQRRWDWVERTFSGERAEYQGVSADFQHFLVRVLGPKSGYAYYYVDSAEHLKRPVGQIYADVAQVAEVRRITYPAADGLQIPAYLTLPPGRPEKGLPLIVMPHGGPEARDEFGFDWWAQALAAQGYAVLQPNFRGSNLNVAWVEKGFGEWGRKMQTDLSDGLAYLAKTGLADPNRACIVGASYGGYAALAGAALQPGTYRCAVSLAGISDPEHMLRWVLAGHDHSDNLASRYWNRYMGVSGPGDPRLAEISPLAHAANVAAPLMLIHGKEDTTVPYEQSAMMAKALEKLRKPVEFVTLAKEDHYLSRSETRLQMLTASVAFLRRNNPPD